MSEKLKFGNFKNYFAKIVRIFVCEFAKIIYCNENVIIKKVDTEKTVCKSTVPML